MLAQQPDLQLVAGEAEALELANGAVAGVRLADGTLLSCHAVVLATGTFLGGRIFRGEERETGGRVGRAPQSASPSSCARSTCPWRGSRPARRRASMAGQSTGPGSKSSLRTPIPGPCRRSRRAGRCPSSIAASRVPPMPRMTAIRAGLDRSPLFTGAIDAQGPRYCPSIEDKIHRFGDRDGHQIFLEPEGLDTHLIYPNGMSTSLPVDVQVAMVTSIPGLERAVIVTPGYAVEYDHIDPRVLDAGLGLPAIPGLWCAGQINGTTGYEEAAGQGLVAGLNAAAHACGLAPLILDRATSYLGVMVDDLVLQGVTEPYRMLTARAEFRLRLRADNAGTRLGAIAAGLGCLSAQRLALARCARTGPGGARSGVRRGANGQHAAQPRCARRAGWRSPSGARMAALPRRRARASRCPARSRSDAARRICRGCPLCPYLERQEAEVAQLRANDAVKLPLDLDFAAIAGLSNEMVEKLAASRPPTIGAAARIRGITPAALSAILLHAKRRAA